MGVSGGLLASVALAVQAYTAPNEAPDEATLQWALELYEHQLPAISWASARVATGEPRSLITTAFEPVRTSFGPPKMMRVLKAMERHLSRPGLDPRTVRSMFEALDAEARRLGLPFHADVELEHPWPDSARWVVWLKTYRISAKRRAETASDEYTVWWLDRLDHLGVREERMGWRKAGEKSAVVLLDVVRRHWREDLAPRLGKKSGGRRRPHLYAELKAALVEDLGRPTGAPVEALANCEARFGSRLRVEPETEIPPEALACAELARGFEPIIVDLLARRVEQHEIQHAIDDRALDPPSRVMQQIGVEAEISPEQVTAELSAILAEIARGPEPRLALAHALSLGSELGRAHAVTADVLLDVLNPAREDALTLLQRPQTELAMRARHAHLELFERELESVRVRSEVPLGAH